MTMFQPMLKQVPDKELAEVRAQVVAKGLLRKVATQNGVRYEITDAGWRFVKEYEDTQRGLGENRSKLPIENHGILVEDRSSQESFVQQAELLEHHHDPWALQRQYEVVKPNISIVIPTLDEAKTIGDVLNEIRLQYQWRFLSWTQVMIRRRWLQRTLVQE